MLGAAVYSLRTKNTAKIPYTHGRLMHATFFSLLHKINPELASYIHDLKTQKPFTVSELLGFPWEQRKECNFRAVSKGMQLTWRITAWNEDLLECLPAIYPGTSLRIGSLDLEVEACCMSPEEHPESGIISEDDLIAACLSVPRVQEISFSFRSPVSFRYFNQDYPWPLPEYIFGSLADKWLLCGYPLALDRATIRTITQELLPRQWHGRSRTVYPKADRGVLAFEGDFSYCTNSLSCEEQQCLLILAQFANFSGVGRLTGHGFGQTRTTYC